MKFLLIPLLFLALAACSQTPAHDPGTDSAPLDFGTSGSDTATGLAKHSSGVYAVGYTSGNLHTAVPKGNDDAFISKYATNGDFVWGRQFGTSSRDIAESVASDGDNNAYVVGYTPGSLEGSQGSGGAFVRKYTAAGNLAWTRQFGHWADIPFSVAAFGSSIYVVGYTYGNLSGTNMGAYDAFIRKYNPDGSVAWTRQFGTSADDRASDVAVDGSGSIYVVGQTGGSLTGTNGGHHDMFIRKYSPSGGVLWTQQLHYSSSDFGNAVAISGSHVFLVGEFWFDRSDTDREVRVVKFTTAGTLVWAQRYGQPYGPIGSDYVSDASADSTGNLYIAGRTYTSFAGPNLGGGDGYVIKLNPSGGIVWRKQLATSDVDLTNAVLVRTDAQIFAAGSTFGQLGFSSSGRGDAFLSHLRGSDGSILWADQ